MSLDEDRLVAPFYLGMMGTNAIGYADAERLRAVVTVGRSASVAEVVGLLGGAWRPRVMGAWFSLLHDSEAVTRAVLRSLQTSQGSLTAPPLAVAAVLLAADQAQGTLAEYVAQDVLHDWGSAGIVSAAIEHLGGRAAIEPSAEHISSFEQLHAVGMAVRDHKNRPSACE